MFKLPIGKMATILAVFLLVKNLKVPNKKIFISVVLILAISAAMFIGLGSIINASQSSNRSLAGNVASTEDKAVEIALSLAQTYVQENNRTIATIKTTLTEDNKPYWFIEIGFKPVENPGSEYHLQTPGYEVAVWADTGEIYHHGAIPIYSEEDFKISLDEAIKIAYPLAQVYAQENNRTIATSVTLWAGYVGSRACWQIDINFEPVNSNEKNVVRGHPHGISAYAVSIWGDTGEIQFHGEQGWYG